MFEAPRALLLDARPAKNQVGGFRISEFDGAERCRPGVVSAGKHLFVVVVVVSNRTASKPLEMNDLFVYLSVIFVQSEGQQALGDE